MALVLALCSVLKHVSCVILYNAFAAPAAPASPASPADTSFRKFCMVMEFDLVVYFFFDIRHRL